MAEENLLFFHHKSYTQTTELVQAIQAQLDEFRIT
jgi:succinylarginine dihydrolase